MSKIGIVGIRTGFTTEQRTELKSHLVALGASEIHYGDCRGAEIAIQEIAKELGINAIQPELWRSSLGIVSRIVNAIELLIVFPEGGLERQGSWMTYKHYASDNGVPSTTIWPNGEREQLAATKQSAFRNPGEGTRTVRVPHPLESTGK